MGYLEYFNLSNEPFSHAPMSQYYYASRQHTDALRRLLYAVETMKGLAILIGDIGHGKTTLARRLLDALPEDEFEAAMLVIVHAGVTTQWLLKRIAEQIGVEKPAEDKLALLSQLYKRLVEIHASGKKTVVLIDEAQMLATREMMEEFRGLLNLEVPGHKLISFVFFGLPDIDANLLLDPPLAQRVALRYHLKPLTADEAVAYIRHRLHLVGAEPQLFAAEALYLVYELCRGVPRLMNTLCDNALLETFLAEERQVTRELVMAAATSLGITSDKAVPATTPPKVSAPHQATVSEKIVADYNTDDAIRVVTRQPTEQSAADYLAAKQADDIAAQVAYEVMSEEVGLFDTEAQQAARQTVLDLEEDIAEEVEEEMPSVALTDFSFAGEDIVEKLEPKVGTGRSPLLAIDVDENPEEVAIEAAVDVLEDEEIVPELDATVDVDEDEEEILPDTRVDVDEGEKENRPLAASSVSKSVLSSVDELLAFDIPTLSPSSLTSEITADVASLETTKETPKKPSSSIDLSEIDDLLADLKK